jgi:hypothetical protein
LKSSAVAVAVHRGARVLLEPTGAQVVVEAALVLPTISLLQANLVQLKQ